MSEHMGEGSVPKTRTFERGPVGLTLWSWPQTTAATVRIWRWAIEWHPRSESRLARPMIYVRRWC